MESASVSAVLFAKDLQRVAAFYSQALQMPCVASDEHHVALDCHGFRLTIHQIPAHLMDGADIQQPPVRRADSAIRLTFPVRSIAEARRLADNLGGRIDDLPPAWADPQANVFLGHDPEGNVFKVST